MFLQNISVLFLNEFDYRVKSALKQNISFSFSSGFNAV